VRVIPEELRSLFDENEIAEIAATPITVGTTERDAVDLALAWADSVRKIDLDRSLPSTDRSVWTEHDLAGTLFLRDHLQRALAQLRPELRERMDRYVSVADDRFRACTVDDPAHKMAVVAGVDLAGRPWWWFRVPDSGPITEDLARY
jgi:hypothetical protein